ncbi:MAG: SH3 domain-containing protein, partial [Spirochaetia bacterium]|nr:SH3 domain-containing protein [Spirochaetia bacterium]
MKRFLLSYAAVIGFSLAAAFPVSAQDFQPAQAKITASVLNVRNIASSGGTVVGSVKRGDLVQVIERSKAQATVDDITEFWYRIQLPKSQTGWVFGGYITFEVNLESGLRWKTVKPTGDPITSVVVMPRGEVIVGTRRGELFATTDKGRSFRKIVPQALGSSLKTAYSMVENAGAL